MPYKDKEIKNTNISDYACGIILHEFVSGFLDYRSQKMHDRTCRTNKVSHRCVFSYESSK